MTYPLQTRLPFTPEELRLGERLPGVRPMARADWLQVDEAYAGQIARRDALLAEREGAVHAMQPEALPACRELQAEVLAQLAELPGFDLRADGKVRRPDGQVIAPDREAPLRFLGRLLQEDLVILEQCGAEHVMTAAVLCFPASWTLSEKIGRPLTAIHTPVAAYDAQLARRVQRMFDVIRPEQPLCRHNLLFYKSPELHAPRSEGEPHRDSDPGFPFVRSERQCLLRLPKTQAVVFSIHTYMLARTDLTEAQGAVILG
ncbi:heme-dependent oxidative N-demethylase family protein [Pseudoruegeria sp. SHC-113]|uniref:heme-dependent oxidative N-demethylase family protein n=1 Tax=Pseudoruegeria sp. SHC-113 TaxID=2855439 RepID=UPI0021BAE7DC|nr:DUF3445 domain-containing protein [Pseudoruegeria sp. SHC-113]MCT8160077.1 DUF3445 domain-containing protein [Pseudoruegeria sp. SHC-113]